MAKTAYLINNVTVQEQVVRTTLKEVSAYVGYGVTGKNLHQQPHISTVLVDDLGNVVDELGSVLAEVQDGTVVQVLDESATAGTQATEEEVLVAMEAAIEEEQVDEPEEVDVPQEPTDTELEEELKSAALTNKPVPPVSTDSIEYPEKGTFTEEKAIKKYIKKLTDDQLQEWCELEGIKWNSSDNESINRMRMAMAIKAFHSLGAQPATATGGGAKKGKGKYSHITTEQLMHLALEHEVDVKDDKGDDRILRMYTIMALRTAGVLDENGNILKKVTA